MNLPTIIADLIKAQNDHDSSVYADCFTATAVVIDEGNTHTGKTAIRNWIEKANQEYQTVMEPLAYAEPVLTARVSGNFPGSPIVLQYHFEWAKGLNPLCQSLKIVS